MASRTEQPRIPAYFGHSYRYEDRDVTEFFGALLWEHGFLLRVDPRRKDDAPDTLSVPYLELMMKRSACFAAVVTQRPEPADYGCSPYILFEYGLAVQAQKPRLAFVEQGVSGRYFPVGAETCEFNRSPARLQDRRKIFSEKMTALAERSRPYRESDIQLLGRVGLLFGQSGTTSKTYTRILPDLKRLLSRIGHEAEEISLDFEVNFQFALKLDQLDFVILDVGPSALPEWVYAFVHGRFIPAIKLVHLDDLSGVGQSLSPLVSGQLLRGVEDADEPVLFWRDQDELEEKLLKQIEKFRRERQVHDSFKETRRYFRGLGRSGERVFISNANDANEFASRLSRALYREGIEHFQYQSRNTIPLGSDWQKGLRRSIRQSGIFAYLVTEGYRESRHCQEEYEQAVERSREGALIMIPFFLGKVSEPNPPEQGIDLCGISRDKQIKTIVSRLDDELREERMRAVTAKKTPKEVDIALITILPEEYQAVLNYLDRHRHAGGTREQPNLYAWELGEVISESYGAPYQVVVAMAVRPGTNSALVVTKDTVERWKPRYVLLIGIAGGLRPEELKKGDVVVADVIYGYEYGKMLRSFKPRHHFTDQVDTSLLGAAQALKSSQPGWMRKIRSQPPAEGTTPVVKVGTVASGDKVVDDLSSRYIRSILRSWPGLWAVEMEGAGLAAAIRAVRDAGGVVSYTMVRGISDLPRTGQETGASSGSAQTRERDAWKSFAAEAAACFAIECVRRTWPEGPRDEQN
jgi:nucleoside phosphorylase